jgi:hypothetical protein
VGGALHQSAWTLSSLTITKCPIESGWRMPMLKFLEPSVYNVMEMEAPSKS